MDQPGESFSEPFNFSAGGVLSVAARALPQGGPGVVEFVLEGSEDKTYWAEMARGAVSAGERVEIPIRGRTAPWSRIRLRSSGGQARVRFRGLREGDR